MTDNNTDLFLQELQSSRNSLSFKDFLYLCLGRWWWFAISVVLVLGVAAVYILRTPPVYTRSASLLIKEESGGGGSFSDAAGVMGDLSLFRTNTNVNNEMQSLQSPAVMMDVVRRLKLNISYSAEGRFHDEVLYGTGRPFEVVFEDLGDNTGASFTVSPNDDGTLSLGKFTLDGEKVSGSVTARYDSLTATPIGGIRIVRSAIPSDEPFEGVVRVGKSGVQAAATAYSKNLVVGLNDDESTVINLSIDDVCPQRAEDVLNTLIAVYNEDWIKDKNQIAVSTSMFIDERLAVIEHELGIVDEDISAYKSENLLPDVQAAASMYMSQSSETSARILELSTQLAMTRYVRNYLAGNTGENQLLPANSGIQSSGIEQQIADYNSLQLQRNNLVANSSETNPLVVDMDQSLKTMRGAIITSIDNHIETLNTQIDALEHSERRTSERIAENPSQGRYLLSVERQQKVKESLYLFLLQKREENELSQAFTAYNTRVITPPMGTMIPTSPNKSKILMVALVLGLLIPVAAIYLLESMNTRVRGRKDLEDLTLPFAGEIPLSVPGGLRDRFSRLSRARRKKLAEEHSGEIVIRQGSRNVVNEAFRVLRTNLEFIMEAGEGARGCNVCLFTSFNVGSGKTFLAANTAACFALKGKKVLAVDCDLRKASLSLYAGSPARGISDYLARRCDDVSKLIVPVGDSGSLFMLPVGTMPPNPAELLAEPRFAELVESLRSDYDYIFIDCPPVEMVADTQIIDRVVDRTLFVVRAGLLERDMLPVLQADYDGKKFRNMVMILNGTDAGEGRYGYRYGYKYGYHYGYSNGSDHYYSK